MEDPTQARTTAVTLRERYLRAAQLSAPAIASRIARGSVDGYWLNDGNYFFVSEQWDEESKCLREVACIADRSEHTVREVVEEPLLRQVLSSHLGRELKPQDLVAATFDMPDCGTLGVSVAGHDVLIGLKDLDVRVRRQSLAVPAAYSPDQRFACVVRGHDLSLMDLSTGSEHPITIDGAPNNAYGQLAESALSALSYRKSPAPQVLWSPDSRWLLTQRIDERSVPVLPLVQHVPPNRQRPIQHQYRYSLPGDPVANTTYVAIEVASGVMRRFEDFQAPLGAFSLFRKAWFAGPDVAWCIRSDRYYKQLWLVRLDLSSGRGRVVLTESVGVGYIDLHPIIVGTPNVRTLTASPELVWYSERSGRGHLYLYDSATGALKNQITGGDYVVRDIVHVDEQQRELYFLAGGLDPRDPMRRCLCRIRLDGHGFQVLAAHDGDVFVPPTEPCGMDQSRPFRPSYSRPGIGVEGTAVIRYSNVCTGNQTVLETLRQGGAHQKAMTLAHAPNQPLRVQEFVVKAADGFTPLHGAMFLPPDFEETSTYPMIDYIYPGPQIPHKPQASWSINASPAMSLAQLGFVVVMLNTRGTPGRGRDFHQVGYGSLLEPQLADHAAAMTELTGCLSFIDASRVGVIGHSGGGYAAACALFDYRDVYSAGVAICGNHDPDLYASSWSDRYRGRITDRTRSYGESSNAAAAKLEGRLLLVAGDMDENVHPAQLLGLVDALIRANKDFELLLVPNASHLLFLTDGYVQRRVWDFLVRTLLQSTPPRNVLVAFDEKDASRAVERLWHEVRQ